MKTYKYIYLFCLLAVQTVSTFAQDTMLQPVNLGSKSLSFCYTDTKNTTQFLNDYVGQSTNDVFYKFSITVAMDITVSHCGSEVNDTYLTVLNESGTRIAYNDDYSGTGKCTNQYNSYIKLVNLAPGTYYVVSEGYSENGNITTTIEGIKPLPATGLYDGSAVIGAANIGQNYIQTITPTVATSDVSGLGINESLQSIQYFDGFGRPIETVQRGITTTQQDLATFTEYDKFGRKNIQWLPIPTTGNGAFTPKSVFTSGSTVYGGDARPFAEAKYEASPLNRVNEEFGAGNSWFVNNKSDKTSYNTNDETIALFYVNVLGTLTRGDNYATGTLYKTVTTDEDENSSTEYTDISGQIVMKQSSTDVQTYYVYNDLGQLSYVLPPLAVDNLLSKSIGIPIADTDNYLKSYAYLYKYDGHGNMIEKRLPGCDWIYMVYDKADRIVLSQDGNQRAKVPDKQWTVTKYDVFGRVAYTGTLYSNYSRSQFSTMIKGELITEVYDGTSNFETTGYTCTGSLTGITPLTVNYYDDYSFISNLSRQGIKDSLAYDASKETEYGIQHSSAKGLLTGTRTYVLDDSKKYTTTAIYYDSRGRVIQSRSTNQREGCDIEYNEYNFSGQVTKNLKVHNIKTDIVKELFTYDYDHAGRVKTVKHKVNDAAEVALVNMSQPDFYDELGRLKTKKRHNNLDTESFDYNIRNWPTSITSGTFEEKLYYNSNPINTGLCFNGNISYKTWTYNSVKKGYAFDYDDLNRLTSASFKKETSTHVDDSYNETFTFDKMGNIQTLKRKKDNVQIDDLTFHYTNSEKSNQPQWIDDSYGSTNLARVKEYQNKSVTTDEMAYDANGNLTKDLDRDIVTVKYNLLNLPDLVQFKNGNQIINKYDAGGRKLSSHYISLYYVLVQPMNPGEIHTVNYEDADVTGDEYFGSIDYSHSSYLRSGKFSEMLGLKRIYNQEGYSTGLISPVYYYYRKDHLGNNCEVWKSSDNTIAQKTQYYPSGLPWVVISTDKASLQPNKYNGKEFVEMHGYDTYDYGHRGLYAAIDRFTTIDWKAEETPDVSPYSYACNNPIRYRDENGDGFNDLVKGFVNAVTDASTMGITNKSGNASYDDANDYNTGQVIGNVTSIILGGLETIAGGGTGAAGVTLAVAGSGTGVAIPAGAAVATGGATMMAHGTMMMAKATGNLANQKGRTNTTVTSSTRKEAKDARPKPEPAKPGEKQVTNQTRNKSGEGNKMKTDGNSQTPHFHDKNHNKPNKPNVHYRTTKKIKPNE